MSKSITLDRIKLIAEMARQNITGEELAQKSGVSRCSMRPSHSTPWRSFVVRVCIGAPGLPVRSMLRAGSDLMGFLTGQTSTVPWRQPVVSVCAISLPTRPRREFTVA